MPLYTGTSGMLPAMLRLFRFQIQGFAVPFVVLVNEHNRIVLSWAGLHQPAVPVVYCKVSFHAGPDSDSLALLKEVELGEEPFVSSGAVVSDEIRTPAARDLHFGGGLPQTPAPDQGTRATNQGDCGAVCVCVPFLVSS